MRLASLVILLLLTPFATPAQAQDIPFTCESIMANAERSKSDMAMAASTYFHGIFMGEPCVKVDYARAFDLMARSGTDPAPFLRVLRERAASGNPNAKRALDRYGP